MTKHSYIKGRILKNTASKIVMLAAIISLTAVLLIFLNSRAALYQGPISDHFDGRRFLNQTPDHTLTDMLKWMWEMETVEWPEWVDDPPQPKPIEEVNKGELRITYINHATTLIQLDGLNILTDPFWSERAGPISWLGSKRIRAPGVAMQDLPTIDAIIISHDHYDHLDLASLRQLTVQFKPLILVGLGVKPLLESKGFSGANIVEMDWWQDYSLEPDALKITFVPAWHNSGRSPFAGNRTLWGGFVIEGSAGRVYFAGDTAYGQFLDQIRERFAPFRLTIFPIGSYEKRWFMKNQHFNPDDAVQAHQLLESKQSVGMHFGTILEHPEQTIDAHEQDLAAALEKYNLSPSAFWVLKFGEGRYVSE